MPNNKICAPHNVSRREMLKRVASASAAGTVAVIIPAADVTKPVQAQTPAAVVPLREALETLTAAQSDTLEAMVARIVPTDSNGPGAAEARAAHYIDRALAGPLASSKSAYVSGLAAIEAYAQSSRGASFTKLNSQDQDAVLSDFEKNVARPFLPNPAGFFGMVRDHTMQGMFSDPYYGGNANFIGWDLIGYPGIRMVVSAEDQSISTPPKPLRKSAYDEAMFSKREGNHGH
jgi:gluconate 2-dehydrogenase gamma chain